MNLAPRCLPLLACLASLSLPLAAQPAPKSADVSKLDPAMGVNRAAAENLDWHDVTTWGVEGREWTDRPRLRWFDRFPAEAQKTVTPAVWSLSRDSAGMMVRFQTDATAIHVHYIPGDKLYGTDTEGATDASHASDLGFMRQSDVMEPILRTALRR